MLCPSAEPVALEREDNRATKQRNMVEVMVVVVIEVMVVVVRGSGGGCGGCGGGDDGGGGDNDDDVSSAMRTASAYFVLTYKQINSLKNIASLFSSHVCVCLI